METVRADTLPVRLPPLSAEQRATAVLLAWVQVAGGEPFAASLSALSAHIVQVIEEAERDVRAEYEKGEVESGGGRAVNPYDLGSVAKAARRRDRRVEDVRGKDASHGLAGAMGSDGEGDR